MTYCAAIAVKSGLVFTSDSRTNAGVDNVSTYSKMHTFGNPGERQIVILSAGNLATTQAVITQVKRDISHGANRNLMTVNSVSEAADYLGQLNLDHANKHNGGLTFEASFIIGGQVLNHKPKICLVYPEGNHITTSKSTPYLQIGESKYGKPILDRIITPETSLETASLCSLVSMDSTMRSNLTVGPPIEIMLYDKDSFILNRHFQFEEDSEYLREIRKQWDVYLRESFGKLPPIAWGPGWDQSSGSQEQMQNPD